MAFINFQDLARLQGQSERARRLNRAGKWIKYRGGWRLLPVDPAVQFPEEHKSTDDIEPHGPVYEISIRM